MRPLFTIVVVCLNAGDKLMETMISILRQTFFDYEVVLKDGGSTDGSVADCQRIVRNEYGEAAAKQIHYYFEEDRGIYDAMNQAISHAEGQYLIFMNCGDAFYGRDVLRTFADIIRMQEGAESAKDSSDDAKNDAVGNAEQPLRIFYGNRYHSVTGSVEYSPTEINPAVCYRNIPCHQTCFYSASCFGERQYEPEYKVRADYEHFLWCYFKGGASFTYVPECVCSYEGGGYSDINAKRSRKEHKQITAMYFSKAQRFRFKAFLILTLQPVRHFFATNHKTAERYNRLVKKVRKI